MSELQRPTIPQGYMSHNGTSNIPRFVRVDIQHRDGTILRNVSPKAYSWLHRLGPNDIVAWRPA